MPDQLITPADAEQAVIDELTPWIKIGTGIPEPKPDVFARVVATGGVPRDMVTDKFTLVLEVFAKLETTGLNTANEAIARIQLAARKGALGDEVCYGVEVAALPQNYPLPSVPSHKRYITTIVPAMRRRITTL